MAELNIADFSGGLSLGASLDKIPQRECILADNCRFTELGSVAAAGASTKQNSSAYTDGANTNVWSIGVNPTVAHIALVGNDVYAGTVLSGLSSLLDEVNSASEKTSFAEQNERVFYDTNGTPRFVDGNAAAHTVDWAPPIGTGITDGPNSSGTQASTDRGASYPAWSNPSNAASSNNVRTIVALTNSGRDSDYLTLTNFGFSVATATVLGISAAIELRLTNISGFEQVTFYVTLIKAGVPAGETKVYEFTDQSGADTTITLGGISDLWDTTWTDAQVDASTFGIQISAHFSFTGFSGPYTVDVEIDHVTLTVTSQASSFIATSGAAGVLNATYTYKATFYDIDGNESQASEATASVSPTNDVVDLSAVSTGDSKTVGRRIYRKGGALTFYYRVGQISDNATTTFQDNQSDAATLADGILLAGEAEGDDPNTRIGSSADVKYPAFYYDRLFWADQTAGRRNRVVWSKPTHPFAYPGAHFFDVGDEKPITRIVPFLDDLIIFKTDSIWRLTGRSEDNFQLTRTPATVGTTMPFTVVKLQDRIMFTNSQGLWFFDGVTARKATNRLDRFFDGETVNGIAPISVTSTTEILAEATSDGDSYYLAYSDDGAGNTNVLKVDISGGTIGRFTANALSLAANPTTGIVYYGDASGFIKTLDDLTATNDATATVPFAYQTKFFYPERGSNVSFTGIEIEADTSGQNITVQGYFDGNTATAVSIGTLNTTSRGLQYLPIPPGASRKARSMSFKISASLSTVNESNSPAVTMYAAKIYIEELRQRSRTSV